MPLHTRVAFDHMKLPGKWSIQLPCDIPASCCVCAQAYNSPIRAPQGISYWRFELVESITACNTCGLLQRVGTLQPGAAAECFRCGSVVGKHRVDSLGRTAAFSLAALIFFVPANIYPILLMDFYGAYSERDRKSTRLNSSHQIIS